MNLIDCRRTVDRLLEARRRALASAERERSALAAADSAIADVEEAQRVAQAVARTVQQRVHEGLARVVNRCLAAVFEEPYTFSLRFEGKRGRTEARRVFERDGVELDDPLNEVGGGVVDVAAFGMRVGCLLLSRPAPRRFLALDEPFSHVRGRGNKARTREMIVRLAADLGFQILLSTDIPEFQAGTVVEVG